MKNLKKRINVIFTGKNLKFWYIACGVIIFSMVFSFYRNKSVTEYELTVFYSSGTVAEKRIISKSELPYINDLLPVSKSYKPLK